MSSVEAIQDIQAVVEERGRSAILSDFFTDRPGTEVVGSLYERHQEVDVHGIDYELEPIRTVTGVLACRAALIEPEYFSEFVDRGEPGPIVRLETHFSYGQSPSVLSMGGITIHSAVYHLLEGDGEALDQYATDNEAYQEACREYYTNIRFEGPEDAPKAIFPGTKPSGQPAMPHIRRQYLLHQPPTAPVSGKDPNRMKATAMGIRRGELSNGLITALQIRYPQSQMLSHNNFGNFNPQALRNFAEHLKSPE